MSEQLLSKRYRILRALGAGGMGNTYLAEDTHMPGYSRCVVKQLRPASQESEVVATAKRLFYSEAEALQQLGEHDRIPRLLAYFEQEGEFYLVQEYIEGHALTQELVLGQRWLESQVIELLQEILEILVVVHGQGTIHRDIKPDNIMRRRRDGKLVLIDFGAVKQIQLQQASLQSQASATVVVGTVGYMPMEQATGKPRACSDLYAVGMVAIQALTGLLPLQLREDDDGEVVWQDQAEASDALGAVLTAMVRHYFKLRYQTAAEALVALQQLTSSQISLPPTGSAIVPVASAPESFTDRQYLLPTRPATRSKRWFFGLGAAVLAVSLLSMTTAAYLSWHENAFAKSLNEIRALLDRGNYGTCINRANALQQQTSLSLALKPANMDPLGNLLADCQLEQGKKLAEAGEYEGAIQLVDSIESDAVAYGEAQALKKDLLQTLQILKLDEELYLRAADAFGQGDWDDVVTAADRIVSEQWEERARPLRDRARVKIEERVALVRARREAERQERLQQQQRELARQERLQQERAERERLEQEQAERERERKEREAWCSRNSGC